MDKHNVGDNVYIDLGDSIHTGGEIVGIIAAKSDTGITVNQSFIPYERILDLQVL